MIAALAVLSFVAAIPSVQAPADARAPAPLLALVPTLGVTTLGGEAAVAWGLRATWALDRAVTFGVVGELFADADGPVALRAGARTRGLYAGLLIEGTLAARPGARLGISATLGTGRACARVVKKGCADQETMALVEPALTAQVQLARAVRLGVGIGYRIASSDAGTLDMGDLSGVTARVGVVLGLF